VGVPVPRTSVGLSARWMRAYTVSLVEPATRCGDEMRDD
jgi:hypothetical protein